MTDDMQSKDIFSISPGDEEGTLCVVGTITTTHQFDELIKQLIFVRSLYKTDLPPNNTKDGEEA